MIPAGINVAIGTDNIADLLKPFTSGNMWTELRFLLESCRFYDIDELVKIPGVGRKTANLVLKQIQAPPDMNGSVSYGNRFFNKKLGVLVSGTIQTTYQASVNNYLGTQLNPNTNNLDTTSWNRVQLYNQINRKGFVVRLDYWFNEKNQISF